MIGDDAIIELFFARNETAIHELDSKYGAFCRKLSSGIVGDSRDAEECVNDSYLGVWNTVPPQRPNSLLTYLSKIVRNTSINRYRRNTAACRSCHYDVALEELENSLVSPDTPQQMLEAEELKTMLQSFLDRLSAENRVIFLRRYWFCDAYADIARQVGLTEKNVSVRLNRMRADLRLHLQKGGVAL